MKMFFLVIVAVLIGGAALCFSNRTNSGAESTYKKCLREE